MELYSLDSPCIMSSCGSLPQLLYAGGGSLTVDNWTRHHSVSIAEYHQTSLIGYLFIYLFIHSLCQLHLVLTQVSLRYSISGIGHLLAVYGTGLKLKQILDNYHHKFCAIIDLASLAGRTDCKLRVLWMGWYPGFSFGRQQSTFLHQRFQKVGIKAPCTNQLNLSTFSKLCGYCSY